MKALVTGGMGFIGTNFVKMHLSGLLTGLTEITVIDKLTYAGSMANYSSQELECLKFIHDDINNSELVMQLVAECDIVVNFAAESHVDRSITSAAPFLDSNVKGVQTLLDAVRKNPNVIFIQISTDEVYGSISEGSWTENQALSPNSPYSASKASADLLALAYSRTYDLDVRITRCSNNYGPWQNPEKFIPRIMTNALREEPIPIYGNGSNVREWIHVTDHCRDIQGVISRGKTNSIYNIGSGVHLTNLELAKLILSDMGVPMNRMQYTADRLGHDFRYSVDTTKLSTLVGATKHRDIREDIPELVNWYRNNRNWWSELIE